MNHRNPYQDYHAPAFYMITMTTLERRPLFATCADNKATLNENGWLVYNLWHNMPKAYPELFKPHGRYFDLCLQGRLLILSAYPDTKHPADLTREKCLLMNAWCEQIAETRGL